MKRNLKKHVTMAITVAMLLGSTLNVNAAPKTMPDGQVFDAEFYAKNYPDVVAALGTDEAALYNHYVSYGKAEGRKPYADAQTEKAQGTVNVNYWTDYEKLGDGQFLQHPLQWEVLTPGGEVTVEMVIQMAKDIAPTGTEWGMETYYDTISPTKGRNIAKRQEGCGAFAFWLTDAIFGETPMVRYDNTEANMMLSNGTFEYCMYDIVCYTTSTGSFHGGVVIGADPKTSTLYLAEGNVNGKVDWNRSIKVDGTDTNKIARVYRREGIQP